jgi:long-chain acyl-CoA synthetase
VGYFVLTRILRDVVDSAPDSLAVVGGSFRLTYKELYERVSGMSEVLTSLSIGPGDCVSVILPNCAEFVVSFFAAARIGSLFLALNPLLKIEEMRRPLIECAPRAVITNQCFYDLCRAAIRGLGRPIEVINACDCSGRLVIPFKRDSPLYADEPFLIQYSSGSTGRLKQVRRSQRNLACEAQNFTKSAGVTSGDRILCVVPLHHAHGLGNGLLAATYAGATLVLGGLDAAESYCEQILRLIEREQITMFPGVPYLFGALADTSRECGADLRSLRLAFSAGNSLPRNVFDQFLARFDIPVRQLYGCTEAGSISINLDGCVKASWDSVGRPLAAVEVKIVNEAGCELPALREGDIIVRSPALTSGYVNASAANSASFRGGFFYTGDLGRKDEAGRIYITGRKRRFIDTGGYKVDPIEIEDVLKIHPNVAEAVVVGVEVPGEMEVIKAAIVPRGECKRDEILAYCRARLADYKLPAIIDFVAEIPKSALGKIKRGALIETNAAPGAVELVSHARRILSELLGIEALSIDSDRPLVDYGLQSAQAVQFSIALASVLGIAVPATLIWRHPTLAALTGALASKDTGGAGAVVRTAAREPLGGPVKPTEWDTSRIATMSEEAAEAELIEKVKALRMNSQP